MEKACSTSDLVTICGDFNMPTINWNDTIADMQGMTPLATSFVDTIDDLFLTQHINQPTRKRGTDRESTLDLVLTDHQQIIKVSTITPPIGKSDHYVVSWSSSFRTDCDEENAPKELKHNYFKGQYRLMRESMGKIDWQAEFKSCADINEMTKKFENIMKDDKISMCHCRKKVPDPSINARGLTTVV